MVEAPFVGAPQIAVLDLIGQQVKGIEAVEQMLRCRRRRVGMRSGAGGTFAAEAGRQSSVATAIVRVLLGSCSGSFRRRVAGVVFRDSGAFWLAMDCAGPWRREFAEISPPARLAPLTRRPLVVEAFLLGAPARDARDGVAHGECVVARGIRGSEGAGGFQEVLDLRPLWVRTFRRQTLEFSAHPLVVRAFPRAPH